MAAKTKTARPGTRPSRVKSGGAKPGRAKPDGGELRILVTNDDGIYAPGLKVLERIAKLLSNDVWVVAPEAEQSGASHSLTLHDPLRKRRLSSRRFSVSGTPTDCVVMAIDEIIPPPRPTLLLSGVNRGANLAEDVSYSGTIAAAMEGTLLGVPSVALSQVCRNGRPVPWSTVEAHAPDLLRKLLKRGWPKEVLLNLNFPDVASNAVSGIHVSVQGRRDAESIEVHERRDPRGNSYYWIGFRTMSGTPPKNTDLGVVEAGAISVTPLQLNLTHEGARRGLQAAIK
ncbi:MAG: 5'/3'-nucleotidase SurE [Proteobacteria bacterium]|nr:5'/3'-nucleotidase SurE [Pseudomonadota bacterium]